MELAAGLRRELPGHAVPRFMVEIPGGHGKVPAEAGHVHGLGSGRIELTDLAGRRHPYPETALSREPACGGASDRAGRPMISCILAAPAAKGVFLMDMTITLTGGKRVEADYHGMKIVTDQPVQAGGEGTAPAPFHLFLASIGTCAGFYVADFCQHPRHPDRWDPARPARASQPREQDDRADRDRDPAPRRLPGQARKAVVSAANLCTVKKHLTEPPAFEVFATRPSEARLGAVNS